MPRYLPLDARLHRDHAWLPFADYAFAANDTLVPVVAEELGQLLPTLPLAFQRRDADDGAPARFELVAVQSLTPRLNLMVHPDGRWLGGYIPAHYRGYPFRLLPVGDDQRLALCIDLDSGLLLDTAEDQGTPLFTPEGQPSEPLARIMAFHEKLEKNRRLTQLAVEVLAQRELICAWPLKLGEGDEQHVDGLYRIDEAALNALPAEQLGKLRQGGGLAIAYAQLFSQHRLSQLSRLYRLRERFANTTPDIEALFGEDDDLQFDFSS